MARSFDAAHRESCCFSATCHSAWSCSAAAARTTVLILLHSLMLLVCRESESCRFASAMSRVTAAFSTSFAFPSAWVATNAPIWSFSRANHAKTSSFWVTRNSAHLMPLSSFAAAKLSQPTQSQFESQYHSFEASTGTTWALSIYLALGFTDPVVLFYSTALFEEPYPYL